MSGKDDHPEIVEERKEENVEAEEGDDLNVGKGEKKIRKALLKLGLNKVEGVNRVVIRQKDNYSFYVKDPEVYVSKESENSYILFGEITVDDPDKPDGSQAIQNVQAQGEQINEDKKEKVEIVDEGEEVSEEGVDPESIQMVIDETKCSRQKAVRALKKSEGDVVNAILELNN